MASPSRSSFIAQRPRLPRILCDGEMRVGGLELAVGLFVAGAVGILEQVDAREKVRPGLFGDRWIGSASGVRDERRAEAENDETNCGKEESTKRAWEFLFANASETLDQGVPKHVVAIRPGVVGDRLAPHHVVFTADEIHGSTRCERRVGNLAGRIP